VRAGDVARQAIADRDRIFRCDFERRDGRTEDAWIGLSYVDLGRDDRDGEERRERCVRKLLPLHVWRAIGDQREAVIARQISHHRFGIRIDELNLASGDAKGFHRRVDEALVSDPNRGQRAIPDAAAEVRDERSERPQPGRVALELAPQRFSPPDTHRVRVRENG
jgi:hypothetical protein